MSYWPQVKKAVGASEKIFEYVERKPDTPPDGLDAPQALEGHVHFKNITFAYPKRPDTNVLKVRIKKILNAEFNSLTRNVLRTKSRRCLRFGKQPRRTGISWQCA